MDTCQKYNFLPKMISECYLHINYSLNSDLVVGLLQIEMSGKDKRSWMSERQEADNNRCECVWVRVRTIALDIELSLQNNP